MFSVGDRGKAWVEQWSKWYSGNIKAVHPATRSYTFVCDDEDEQEVPHAHLVPEDDAPLGKWGASYCEGETVHYVNTTNEWSPVSYSYTTTKVKTLATVMKIHFVSKPGSSILNAEARYDILLEDPSAVHSVGGSTGTTADTTTATSSDAIDEIDGIVPAPPEKAPSLMLGVRSVN